MTDVNIEKARFNLIEQQVRTWEVLDQRVLDALMGTRRECFVPKQVRNLAFADMQLPIGHGQVMMEPKVEARVLQSIDLQPTEQALEIGTGSGYLTACLAGMGAHVTSVDIEPDFTEHARKVLAEEGFDNVTLITGDAAAGWRDGRRYDAIVVTGSLPELHRGFHESLTIGGRLAVIVGEAPIMEGLLITRVSEDQWASESLFETSIPPLKNAPRTARFAL